MCASGSCPVCIERHTRRSWQSLSVYSVTIRPAEPARSGIRVRRVPEEYPPDRILLQAAKKPSPRGRL